MLGYPFIEETNRAVLAQSAAIQGRFYICPLGGQEINQVTIEEVLTATFTTDQPKKYPLAIMMPPPSTGDYGKKDAWREYQFAVFFLQQHGADQPGGAGPLNRNVATGRTMHSTLQDWHDMERVALNYYYALRQLVTLKGLGSTFRLSDRQKPTITPVTKMGNDGVNGVLLQYGGALAGTCGQMEDYPAGYLDNITINKTDSHPDHYTILQTPPSNP